LGLVWPTTGDQEPTTVFRRLLKSVFFPQSRGSPCIVILKID
jgi:hypothetical protein